MPEGWVSALPFKVEKQNILIHCSCLSCIFSIVLCHFGLAAVPWSTQPMERPSTGRCYPSFKSEDVIGWRWVSEQTEWRSAKMILAVELYSYGAFYDHRLPGEIEYN